MKKLLSIVAIAAFTACGSGSEGSTNAGYESGKPSSATAADSISRASDSIMQTGDTSALNMAMGDSTSSSGSHGQGSGSRVGGGKTGGPQGKKSKQ